MAAITISDLNNAKTDVDHIAAIATSNASTAIDRLGNIKSTMRGAVDSIKSINNRGTWAAATLYAGKDIVLVAGTWYVCVELHTSSAAFATDTASKWRLYQGVTSGDLAASTGAALVGVIAAGAGAGLRTAQEKLRDTVSVKDFQCDDGQMVQGDGSHDDTSGIQKALNTGKAVYFPGANYKLSAALTPLSAQMIYGDGPRATTFTQTTAGANVFTVNTVTGVVIRDCKITSSVTSAGTGVYVTGGNSTYLDKVYIIAMGYGIRGLSTNNLFVTQAYCVNNLIDGIDLSTCVDVYINNIYSSGNTGAGIALSGACSGIYIDGAQVALNAFNFRTRFLQPANTGGIPSQVFINQMIADSATNSGIYLDQANTIEFVDCFLSNRGSGSNFWIGPATNDIRVMGGKLYNCTGHGATVRGRNASFVGTSIQDVGIGAANVSNGIDLSGASCTGTVINGVRCYSDANTTRYGIRIEGSVTNTSISGGNVIGNVMSGIENFSNFTNKILNVTGAKTSPIAINKSPSAVYAFDVDASGGNSSALLRNFEWSTYPLTAWNASIANDSRFVSFMTEGGGGLVRGEIDFNRTALVTRYNTTSDGVLKNIIGDADGAQSENILKTTRIRLYSWKEDQSNKPQIGVIAQELYQTFPGAVSAGGIVKSKNSEGIETETYKSWSVDKTAFTFHLIAGWKKHESRITELEAIVFMLASRLTALEQV